MIDVEVFIPVSPARLKERKPSGRKAAGEKSKHLRNPMSATQVQVGDRRKSAEVNELHGDPRPEYPMTRFHHILAPVDFEPSSQEALDVAIDLALAFDAQLTVVHAWEMPVYAYSGLGLLPLDLWAPVERAGMKQLESTLAAVRKRLPRAESLFAKGPPSVELLAAIELSKADLVVMGTHGRQGLIRVFLGSVAETVLRASPVPVLTIRAKAPVPS
jgi:nucleotide-binding universal stress UspA family protein